MRQDASQTQISEDVIVRSSMDVTTSAIGADQAWTGLAGLGSVTGDGVGVAIIDSGVAAHPALAPHVVANYNFTETGVAGKDDYGHGTHVAGIVTNVAPQAHLVDYRVLTGEGWGLASNVIAAIESAIANRHALGIRVLNLSLGGPVRQSYRTDAMAQAVERAVAEGLVVVCSAGNFGKTEDGTKVIGGTTAPCNTPGALTVGALNTFGTAVRSDDEVTTYSSRGPTAYDYLLKPDVVAPGNRLVSLMAPASYLATNYPERQVAGGYISLSGTSMSAAVVSGVVALMLELNPALTPQMVKTALQSTASPILDAGIVGAGSGSINVPASLYFAHLGLSTTPPTIQIAGENIATGGFVFSPDSPVFRTHENIAYPTAAAATLGSDTVEWGGRLLGNSSGGEALREE